MTQLEEHQRAFLLLQVLGADEERLMKSDANKGIPATLGLSAKSANRLRDELAPQYLVISKERTPRGGNATYYRLTERGMACLLELRQYEGRMSINGRAINRLIGFVQNSLGFADAIDASQGAADKPEQQHLDERRPAGDSRTVPSPGTAAVATDISEDVWKILNHMKRALYHYQRYVPIHAVRSEVAEKLGSLAASQAVFDRAVIELRKQGRVRTIPISDPGNVAPEQLQASIPGVNETLFYLEPVA